MTDGPNPPTDPPADPPATPPADPPASPPAEPQRPDYLLPKYKTVEEQARAYPELQKTLGKKDKPPDGPLKLAKPDPLAEKLKAADSNVNSILEVAGIAPAEIVQAFQSTKTATSPGEATAEQYAALDKLGYGKGIVDQIYGQMATYAQGAMDKAVGEAETIAGGESQLKNLIAFASGALPGAQLAEMQERLNNPAQLPGAVRELMQLHREGVGAGGAQPLVEGDGAPGAGAPFTTKGEYIAATSDPRYRSDKAYRDSVDERAAKSGLNELPLH